MTDEGRHDEEASDSYIRITLRGERFEARGMPADSASELRALSEMLLELAREEWLDAHPGRTQVPDGFSSLFDLRLVSIADGCAKPNLVLSLPSSFNEDDDEFDIAPAMRRAPHRLVKTLTAIRDDQDLPSTFPTKYMPALLRIGKTLGADDSMEIGLAHDPSDPAKPLPAPVLLNADIREIIGNIDRVLKATPEPVWIEVEGVITELDRSEERRVGKECPV